MKICKVLMAPLCCRRSRNSKLTTMSIVDDFHTRAHFYSWIWPGCRLEVCRKKCLHIELWQLGIKGLESHCWLSPIKCRGFTLCCSWIVWKILMKRCIGTYWNVKRCIEAGLSNNASIVMQDCLPCFTGWGRRPMVFIKWMSMVNARTSTLNDSAKARCWNIFLNPKQMVVFFCSNLFFSTWNIRPICY